MSTIGPQLMGFMQQVATHPWVMQLGMDLATTQPESMQLVERLKARSAASPVLWPFHAVQFPVAIREARGATLVDADGREMLDLFLGFGTQALHGHNHPEVVGRMPMGSSVGNGYFHPVETELTELLHRFTGQEGFLFVHTGTEATEAAVRLCRAATGKRLLVKFDGAVHGTHDWGVQSSVALMHGNPIHPWPERHDGQVEPVPFVTGVTPPDDLLILPHFDEDALTVLAERKDEIAAVIMESSNISFPFAEKCIPFVKLVRERCRELGIKFILDEVQTGFRWGQAGANRAEGIDADLCTYGKVLSGLGLPLAAVAGDMGLLRHAQTSGLNLMDYGQKTTLMTTHMGNHLALAASFASLSLLASKGDAYYERTRARRDALQARVAGLRSEGIPLHLVGYGDFIGTFLFVDDPESCADARQLTERANPGATLMLSLALRREGIYTYSWPFVFLGDAYDDEQLERIISTVERIARSMKQADFPLTVPWA